MKIAKVLNERPKKVNEREGKLFARAYCHTEGQWIDDWDTHFELALKDKVIHERKTSHAVTIHYK